jgi:hypothetical protein
MRRKVNYIACPTIANGDPLMVVVYAYLVSHIRRIGRSAPGQLAQGKPKSSQDR